MITWRNYMPANKTIKIEVFGGCVTEVTNLPEGYDYEIVDHDHIAEQDQEKANHEADTSNKGE